MQLDINEIQKFLPHRYPFLLIDKVVEMERFKRIVAIKSVSINEGFFQGHFPGKPVICLLYTSPSPRDRQKSRMPSSA